MSKQKRKICHSLLFYYYYYMIFFGYFYILHNSGKVILSFYEIENYMPQILQ